MEHLREMAEEIFSQTNENKKKSKAEITITRRQNHRSLL